MDALLHALADRFSIASIVHYTLVLSPQGQYILGLIETQYQMTPWLLLRQTLKIGNAATMMSALMKIVLAKVSVASITNMFGITTGRDEGMNLNQRYVLLLLPRCRVC